MSGFGRYQSDGNRGMKMFESSALPAFKKPCLLAKPGWHCTRAAGHEGPCAAVEWDTPTQGPFSFKFNRDGMTIEIDRKRIFAAPDWALSQTFTWAELDEYRKRLDDPLPLP